MVKQQRHSLEADMKTPPKEAGPNWPKNEPSVLYLIYGGLRGHCVTSLIRGALKG